MTGFNWSIFEIFRLSRQFADKTFNEAIPEFQRKLKAETLIRIFVDGSAGMGHQSSSIQVMFRLIFGLGYNDAGKKIDIVYRPKWPAHPGPETLEKLALLLPGFDPAHPGPIKVGQVDVSFTEFSLQNPPQEPARFGFTGGAGIKRAIEEKETIKDFARALSVDYFLRLQPYLWVDRSELYLDKRLDRRKPPPETVFVLDHRQQYGQKAYYVPKPQMPPPDVWAWYQEHGSDDQKSRMRLARTLARNLGDLRFCPIYGLREAASALPYPSFMMLPQIVAGAAMSQKNRPGSIVIVDFDDVNKTTGDTTEFLLNGGLWEGSDSDETHDDRLKILEKIFGTPLEERVPERVAIFWAGTPETTTDDIEEALQWAKKGNDRILLVLLGSAPPPIFNYFFSLATLPAVFEGLGTAALALSFGTPFLHLPRREAGTAGNPATSYPRLLEETSFSDQKQYCEDSARWVTIGLASVMPEYSEHPRLFSQSVEAISSFIIQSAPNTSSNLNRYFSAIGNFFGNQANDRLLAAAVILNGRAPERAVLGTAMARSARNATSESPGLENLLAAFRQHTSAGQDLDLFAALPRNRILEFFQAMVQALSGGNTFAIELKALGVKRDDQNRIIELLVEGTSSALGMPLRIAFTFTEVADRLACVGRFRESGPWSLPGVPWIVLQEPGFEISVMEAPVPVEGSVFGMVAGSGLTLQVHYPTKRGWRLQGVFEQDKAPSLSRIFTLAGGKNLTEGVPLPLNLILDFRLQNLAIDYDPDAKTILEFRAVMGTPTDHAGWEILKGLVPKGPTVKNLGLVTTVAMPGDPKARKTSSVFSGDIVFGETLALKVSASLPDFLVSGTLSEIELELNTILGAFLPGIAPPLPTDTKITDFRFTYSPKAADFWTSTTIQGDWTPDFDGFRPITLQELKLEAGYRAGIHVSLTGLFRIGTIQLRVQAANPKTAQEGWIFKSHPSQGDIKIGEIISKLLPAGYQSPVALDVRGIEIEFNAGTGSYLFKGQIASALETPFGSFTTNVSTVINSRGPTAEKREREYSGHVEVAWDFSGAPLLVRYDFAPGSDKYLVIFQDISGEYDEEKSLVTFRFGDRGLGEMVAMLAGWFAPGEKHRLEAPWDILNSINLKNLELKFDTRHKAIGISYGSLGFNIGFLSINSLDLWYSPEKTDHYEKGVWLALDGQVAGRKIAAWDVTKPETAPEIPGRGNKFFDLRLLALGQHVAVAGASEFADVTDAIGKIRGLKNIKGETIPIGGPGQPVFSETSNWLIATNFGILRFGDEKQAEPQAKTGYLIDLSILFNDPNLYALRLELNGEKAKIFKGLKLEIMYKKITDTVGVYQTELTLPDQMRNLDFGAISITLPMISLRIYTNGDFKVDIGFPYNMDFSRSFTVQGIIAPGIPVLGSGGIYFGKLSSATSSQVPQTSRGLFNPVMAFGLGLQLGIGRQIDKGVLKAGFSITVVAVIEGVIAGWHPYLTENPLATTDRNQIRDSYYFWLQGTAGLLGRLYGSIDFAIIKASVNVTVSVMARATYESYRSMPLTLIAGVKVSVSLKISLGLFRITLSFIFAARIEEQVVIGKDEPEKAPWFDGQTLLMRQAPRTGGSLPYRPMVWRTLPPETRPVVNLYLAPLLTIGGEGATGLSGQSAHYVASLFIDTTGREKGRETDSDSSFETLCREVLRWLIVSLPGETNASVEHNEIGRRLVSRDDLSGIYQNLSRENGPTPIPLAAIGQFLGDHLDIRLHTLKGDPPGLGERKEFSAATFPMPPRLKMHVPAFADQTPEINVDFSDFTSCDDVYLEEIRTYFRQLETQVENEPTRSYQAQRQGLRALRTTVAQQSLAGFVFQDYFLLLAKHLVQTALDAGKRFTYPLQPEDSIDTILAWANGTEATPTGNALSAEALVRANSSHPLSGNKTLNLSGLTASVKETDTFSALAQHYGYGLTAAQLILFNQDTTGLPRTGVVVTHGEQSHTLAGTDTIRSLAQALGTTVDQLADDTAFQNREKFLQPLAKVKIPPLAYPTKTDQPDTFAEIAANFDIDLKNLVDATENRRIAGLFRSDAEEHRTLDLPELTFLTVDMIMTALHGTDCFRHLSGMSSRYQMHGVRLPVKGHQITFKNPNPCQEQEECGVFQLTGQQFPLPRLAPDDTFSFSLQKGDGLDWLNFVNPNAEGALEYVLEKNDIFQIGSALSLVLNQGLTPKTEQLGPLDNFQRTACRYTFPNFIKVRTSGELPLPYMSITDQVDATPVIRIFPEGLRKQLSAIGEDSVEREPPRFSVRIGAYNETTSTMRHTPASCYGWGALLEVAVKKLAAANKNPAHPFTYDLIGADETGIVLLERLLAAMNGTDGLIDRIFILYRPNATSSNDQGLQSAGGKGFATFITQSNLSTYTQPVKMMRAALPMNEPERVGILGRTYDFVKLLWECSIVRSGGFHFYYNEPDSGRGIPENLFDDQGVATFSVLITYAKPAREEARDLLGDHMNCVVTGDRADPSSTVVFAQSEVRKLLHTVRKRERLSDIADRYHLTVSELAEQIRDLPLAVGAVLDIKQPTYLVGPASRAPGRELASIASYFGVDAETIKALNPSIVEWEDLPVFTLLHLPEIRFTISEEPLPPCRTLSGVAEYYGISVTALACANRNRESLFPTGAELSIQDAVTNRVATIPPGNIGLHLVRRNPGEVPEPEPVGPRNTVWARPYLEHCYSLLSYAVVENQYFTASHAGVPVGPDDSLEQNEDLGNEHSVRIEEQEIPWNYQQVIPIHRFARFNPIKDVAGLPIPEDNIYAGIGNMAQVRFQWRDYFGNETFTPLNMPELDPWQPLNHPPLRIGYTDPLMGLDAWPGVSADYHFSGTANQPVLQLALSFDPTVYNPDPNAPEKDWRGQAEKDQAVYRKIFYQLHQTDERGNPHVRFRLTTTLVRDDVQALTPAQVLQVNGFVQDIYRYLGRRNEGKEATPPKIAPISRAIDPDAVNPENIFELTVLLTLERNLDLIDDNFKDSQEVARAESAIRPRISGQPEDDQTLAYRRFAGSFEKIFVRGDEYQLKIATGIDRHGVIGQGRDRSLWVVRFGLNTGTGIHYELAGPAVFYGIKPLSTSLVNKTVALYPYRKGTGIDWENGEQKSYAGIELDTWARQCFNAIDNLLAPESAPTAFLIDQLTRSQNLQRILVAKKNLAKAIAERQVATMLTGQEVVPERVRAAREVFYQQLLNELGGSDTVTAIVQFPIKVTAKFQKADDAKIAPRLYGMPTVMDSSLENGPSTNRDYSLSTAKIALIDSAKKGNSDLTFVFTSKNVEDQTSVSLDLSYRVSHLEHAIQELPGIADYQASAWLGFVNPPERTDVSSPLNRPLGRVTIPVPLKAYPTPPSLISQQGTRTAEPGEPGDNSLEKTLQWDYRYCYTEDHFPQDTTHTRIKFNLVAGKMSRAAAGRDLFQALAQFIEAYPDLREDLTSALAVIDLRTSPETEPVKIATAALRSFAELIENIAEAWLTWQPERALFGSSLPECAFTLKIRELNEPDSDRFKLVVSPEGSLPKGIELPVVEIAGYRREPAGEEPGGCYYTREQGGQKQYLRWEEARTIAERTVCVPRLNILRYQNAWSSAFLRRNENLVEVPTAGDFIYQTPEVHFANRLIPLLDVDEPIDLAAIGGNETRPLDQHLTRLFKGLFPEEVEVDPTIQLECRYAYRLQAGLPSVELPVLLLPPSIFRVRADAEIPAGGCPEKPTEQEALVCRLTKALRDWYRTHNPSRDNGRFLFDLRVFSNLNGSQMPLVRLSGLFLDIEKVSHLRPR